MNALSTLARNYVCPKCKASIGVCCRQPKGRKCDYLHGERVALLTKEEKASCTSNISFNGLNVFDKQT